jgi:hypothetical protein
MTRFKPTSGLTRCGLRNLAKPKPGIVPYESSSISSDAIHAVTGDVTAAPLTTQQRKSLPSSDFVFPEKAPGPGSYPIDTRGRGANALSRSSGKPEEATVKRVVCKRYGDLPECGGDNDND